MNKLISIDIKADFGFFRKPDVNNTINLSYNIIHKPAVLGIAGAIVGLEGYTEKGKLPDYYNAFKDIKIGVQPLDDEKGNFQKTNIKYSDSTGFNNKDKDKKPATRLTEEITLIHPQYRIYMLLNTACGYQVKLLDYLSEAKSEFIPYFGKNEFTAWWDKESYKEYDFVENPEINGSIQIKTVFLKDFLLRENTEAPEPDIFSGQEIEIPFMYFERLPKDFDLKLMQYDLGEFVYSSYLIKNAENLKNLFYLKKEDAYVQLL